MKFCSRRQVLLQIKSWVLFAIIIFGCSKVKNNIKLGLFGVDIIIDEELKPWLIEMNVSPSSTAFDKLGESQKKQVWVDSMKIALLKNPSNHEFEKIN